MKKFLVGLALTGLSVLAWALPTLQQVEAEVRQGNYAQAETMMREVVAAKPGSARAHYIYAEILAHDGKLQLAAEEAKKARTIDPDVKFADPEKFRTFEAALLRKLSPATRTPASPATAQTTTPARVAPAQMAPDRAVSSRVAPEPAAAGLPGWIWLAGLAAIGFVVWRMFSRNRAAATAGTAAAPGAVHGTPMQAGAPGAPYGPGQVGAPYGPGVPATRPGSGMLGVGLGAAGGVAAGMLAERMLNSRREGGADRDTGTSAGLFDSPQDGGTSVDLDNRPIDFGTGGNDWDAGSSDAGGGGGGDGGGWD
ncbi:MAG: tetratricopeptide repeat protein [Caldimonas sp.]